MLQMLSFVDWTSRENVMQWKWGGDCVHQWATLGLGLRAQLSLWFGSWMKKNEEESASGSKMNVKLL